MGIPILVRQCLYYETAPGSLRHQVINRHGIEYTIYDHDMMFSYRGLYCYYISGHLHYTVTYLDWWSDIFQWYLLISSHHSTVYPRWDLRPLCNVIIARYAPLSSLMNINPSGTERKWNKLQESDWLEFVQNICQAHHFYHFVVYAKSLTKDVYLKIITQIYTYIYIFIVFGYFDVI